MRAVQPPSGVPLQVTEEFATIRLLDDVMLKCADEQVSAFSESLIEKETFFAVLMPVD